MSTTERLSSATLSPPTAVIVERSTRVEVVAAAPIDASKNNTRVMLTAVSPLLAKVATQPASGATDDFAAEVQELLAALLPPDVLNDPKTKKVLDSLLQLLEQCEEGTGAPATLAGQAKTAIDQAFALLEQTLPDGSAEKAKLEQAKTQLDSNIDQALQAEQTSSGAPASDASTDAPMDPAGLAAEIESILAGILPPALMNDPDVTAALNAMAQALTQSEAQKDPATAAAEATAAIDKAFASIEAKLPAGSSLKAPLEQLRQNIDKNIGASASGSSSAPAPSDPMEALKQEIDQLLATSASLNDPEINAALDALFALLEQPNVDQNAAQTQITNFLTLLESKLPDSPAMQSLFQMIKSQLTEALSNAEQVGSLPSGSSWPAGQSPFDQVLQMIALMMKMLVLVSNSQNLQAQNQVDFLDKVKATLKDVMDQMQQKIRDQIAEADAARHQSFWVKLGSTLLGAFLTIVTGIFLGPVAAAVVAAMFIMQQTGATDAMFSGIDSPTARMFAKIGFSLAAGAAGGGLAGGLDYVSASIANNVATTTVATTAGTTVATATGTTVATTAGTTTATTAGTIAATSAGTAAGDAATVAADDAAAAQVDNLGADAAEDAEEAPPKPWDAFKDGAWSNFKTIGTQILFSTDPITDLVDAIINPGDDPDKKKKAMWMAFGMNIGLILASGSMAGTSTGSSFTVEQMGKGFNEMVQKADGFLQKSLAYTLSGAAKLARSSLFVGAGSLGLSGFIAYHEYELGAVSDDMANNIKDRANLTAAQGRAQDLITQANAEFQQAAEFETNLAKAIGNVNVSNITNQGWEVSQILA